MKNISAISISLLIILSGMHLSVATHFCGGKIAAIKLSVTAKIASCGMENNDKSNPSSETVLSSHCCNDEFTVYSVNNDYAPSEFNLKRARTKNTLHQIIPANFAFQPYIFTSFYKTDISPPDYHMANALLITEICVFRI